MIEKPLYMGCLSPIVSECSECKKILEHGEQMFLEGKPPVLLCQLCKENNDVSTIQE